MGMRQRTLVIRRFGVMSFGIGYYEDGEWVDHAFADATDGVQPDEVHGWYGCCARGNAGRDATHAPIAVLSVVVAETRRAEGAPAGDAVLAN
jgi:hypothetical protein